jgi:hypothetical protein
MGEVQSWRGIEGQHDEVAVALDRQQEGAFLECSLDAVQHFQELVVLVDPQVGREHAVSGEVTPAALVDPRLPHPGRHAAGAEEIEQDQVRRRPVVVDDRARVVGEYGNRVVVAEPEVPPGDPGYLRIPFPCSDRCIREVAAKEASLGSAAETQHQHRLDPVDEQESGHHGPRVGEQQALGSLLVHHAVQSPVPGLQPAVAIVFAGLEGAAGPPEQARVGAIDAILDAGISLPVHARLESGAGYAGSASGVTQRASSTRALLTSVLTGYTVMASGGKGASRGSTSSGRVTLGSSHCS